MLARRVYGRASSTTMTVGGRHINDAAASLGKHHTQLVLHAEQRTQYVCVEGRGVGFCGLFRHWAGRAFGSCAIDSSIQTTKARDSLIDQAAQVILVTHVGTQKL